MGDILGTSLAAIRANRLRSVLTILIIAIGITSLVGIQTAIEVIAREITSSFGRLGATSLVISRQEEYNRPVTYAQAVSFTEKFTLGASSLRATVTPVATASSGARSTDPVVTVAAADEGWLRCSGNSLEEGRNFSSVEISSGGNVCIIGNGIKKDLFGGDSATGRRISFGHGEFRIIGSAARRGSAFGQGTDFSIIIPASSSAASGLDYSITVTPCREDVNAADAAAILMRNIRRLEPGMEDDFAVRRGDAAAEMLESFRSKLDVAALAIGLITLFAASMGLVNIMLVSVKERKREIGLRKALGARRELIALQFLAEAAIIGQIGCAVGVITGIAGGNAVALIMGGHSAIPWKWAAISAVMCLVTSLISGAVPAHRAAVQNPVDALRSE